MKSDIPKYPSFWRIITLEAQPFRYIPAQGGYKSNRPKSLLTIIVESKVKRNRNNINTILYYNKYYDLMPTRTERYLDSVAIDKIAILVHDTLIYNLRALFYYDVNVSHILKRREAVCWHAAYVFAAMVDSLIKNPKIKPYYVLGGFHAWNKIRFYEKVYYFDVTPQEFNDKRPGQIPYHMWRPSSIGINSTEISFMTADSVKRENIYWYKLSGK